jgi:hypothetical protein
VNWYSTKPGNVVYTLTDFSGRVINVGQDEIGSGEQFLRLPVSVFPAGGIYNLQIKQGGFQSNKQIIYMPSN